MPVGRDNSPYPLGTPVTDPPLLQNRRVEIDAALETVAPQQRADPKHAAVLGEQRSGRSTVLLEVARRAAIERSRLVVWLRTTDEAPWDRAGLMRHLLTSTAEALADASSASAAPWYRAWRDRVYLRDRSSTSERDVLSSALVLAVDSEAEIDRVIVERDLTALLEIARASGLTGVVVCIDDAACLTEDVGLFEDFVSTLDAVEGYHLMIAGVLAIATHFREAASPCLARLGPIWLRPFWKPQQIFSSLSAPLGESERGWLDIHDAAFLRDVLRLTGGNPYELMLVGHHLWLTCELGEQDRYVLTPRVLDRVIPHLALLASGGDALRDGAQAIDRLAEEHIRQAVELVALSQLTIREIAIARILKVDSRDANSVDRAILTADIASETTRVLGEVEELQDAGVVQLQPDCERFHVVGGRPASVLLKYKARARIGAEASNQPFELDFLGAVGRALARDATRRTLEAIEGASTLGFSVIMSRDGAGRLSPRPAIRSLSTTNSVDRLVQAEVDLVPWSVTQYDRVAELLAVDDPAIALVCNSVTHNRGQLEYVELWELPLEVGQEDLADAWSTVTEEWEPVVAASDLNWSGCEFAVVRGELARQTLVVVQRFAAMQGVHMLFDRWYKDGDADALARAHRIGDEAVGTMRATGRPDWELGGELSGMLSRVGFLKSFDDALLDEARAALHDALSAGAADKWVTHWNLANIAARQDDASGARTHLDAVAERVANWQGYAFVLFFVPGRPAVECLVKVTADGIGALIELQRAVLAVSSSSETPDDLAQIVGRCRAAGDEGASRAADWVEEALTPTG